MSSEVIEGAGEAELRLRALRRLTGEIGSPDTRLNATAALGVLYDLASSPSTAAAALTLLHELQVYQVEVDLQDEELRRSRTEMEATLMRQAQRYDFAPAGCFTVDRSAALHELNLTAAGMLAGQRDQLLGRTLDSFLAPQSARALQGMLARLGDGAPTQVCALELAVGGGVPRSVQACANRDPDGRHFLVAFVDTVEQ